MLRRKSMEKALFWQEILRRQADSGLSIRKFCASEGFSEPSFYAWRKKLQEPTQGVGRRVAGSRGQVADARPLFVPVKLLDSPSTLVIIHPLGYRIRLTGEVNCVALRQVLETLDERGAR